ncbi:MAG: response regulator transcription factor [Ignavibacteria bacterium]|nr:response regulator transcription factor [Ignavibacteria bacterium]
MDLLIVEDSTKMRNAIRKMFKPYFENIYECDNGISAVTEYELKKPDWVFMDIKMEKMDGITATREITGQFPYARVIIVTGYDDDDFRKEAESNGAVGYVLKENLNEIFKIANIKK